MKKTIAIFAIVALFAMSLQAQLVGKNRQMIKTEMAEDEYVLTEYNAETNTDYYYSSQLELMFMCCYDSGNGNYCYKIGLAGNKSNVQLYNTLVQSIKDECVYDSSNSMYADYAQGVYHWYEYNYADGVWMYYTLDMNYAN